MSYIDKTESKKQRWLNFYNSNKQSDLMFLIQCSFTDGKKQQNQLNHYHHIMSYGSIADRVDWALQQYDTMLENQEWLDDDLVPHISVATGTEIFAQAFGCKVHYSNTTMPCAIPKINSASEAASLKVPDIHDTPLSKLFEIADKLRIKAGEDAILKLPDIQSPVDIAALIWEKSEFMIAMLMEPNAVKELTYKAHQLLEQFLDEWFARYGTEYIAHYPDYFMSGGLTLSEDEVGIVNPDMFNEFFLPHLEQLSNKYGGIGIHCCADSIHQWDNFKKIPNLNVLNICQPEDICKKAFEFFAGFTKQMHFGWLPDGPIETWYQHFPANSHHILQVTANTKDEAEKKAAALNLLRKTMK